MTACRAKKRTKHRPKKTEKKLLKFTHNAQLTKTNKERERERERES